MGILLGTLGYVALGVPRLVEAPPPELAFVPGPRTRRSPTGSGTLDGLRFAAKDVIDVAGVAKTSGNPDWARTHPPAARSSGVIDRLLAAGAELAGKTVTDELTFSLEGDNLHYGIPLNSRSPDRLPGGSSSGSASAVASGLVDFALGTDTGGSVRLPGSFCGIFGIRPTHGRVPVDGITPLAPSLDTVGWLARDGATLARVGSILVPGEVAPPQRFVRVRDAFDLADLAVREELTGRAHSLFGPTDEIEILRGVPEQVRDAYRIIQGREAWALHGPWISETHPHFAPDVQARFEGASEVTAPDFEKQQAFRREFTARVEAQIPLHGALVLPAAPCIALPKDPSLRAAVPQFRERALSLEAIASLCGLPEVVLPVGLVEGSPIGLGVIGPRGSDAALLALARSPEVARTIR